MMSTLAERLRSRRLSPPVPPAPLTVDVERAGSFLRQVEAWDAARSRLKSAEAALGAIVDAVAADEQRLEPLAEALAADGPDAIEPHLRHRWEAPLRWADESLHGNRCKLVPAQAECQSAREALDRATAEVASRLEDAPDAAAELDERSRLLTPRVNEARAAVQQATRMYADPRGTGKEASRARAASAKATLVALEAESRRLASLRAAFEGACSAALAFESNGGVPR